MRAYRSWSISLLAALVMFHPDQLMAENIRVAVASNFKQPIIGIARVFEEKTNHTVTLIFGSTGKHYAQIINGAPYDVFLAADIERPERLEQGGIAVANSRFTYAKGKLVLWSPKPAYVDAEGRVLEDKPFRYLAMANPELAPYGRAAYEVMQARGLWERLNTKVVRGENINQAYQFVRSGNAELGFVAYSQLVRPERLIEGSVWDIPQSLYTPIEQQAVLIQDNEAARAFSAFLQSDTALELIERFGYEKP